MKKFLRNCLIAALMVVFAGLFACGKEASLEHKHEFGEWTVNKQATCTEKGEEKRICACGESELRETAAKGHMFGEWTVEIQPGENQDGKKVRTCSVCGFEQSEKIPAEGVENPPAEKNIIKTEEDLIEMAAGDRTGEYTLGADITLTEKWNTAKKFSGTLDGNGYSIINMNITSDIMELDGDSVDYMVGMFSKNEGIIKNITFKNFCITITGTDIVNADFEGIKASSPLIINNLDIHAGLVGLNKGTIENIKTEVDFSIIPETATSRIRTGSIAGKNNGIIKNCISSGKIHAKENGGYIRAGGITGYMSDLSSVILCESAVSLYAENSDAKNNLGGIIGNIECGTVEKCFYDGTITSKNSGKATSLGGIIGLIDNLSAKFEVMNVTVTECYSRGTLSDSGIKGGVGGLIGEIESVIGENKKITVTDCTSVASVAGAKKRGGFLGDLTLTDVNTNPVSYPVLGTLSGYFIFTGNQCTVSDGYAVVKNPDEIRQPDIFTLS